MLVDSRLMQTHSNADDETRDGIAPIASAEPPRTRWIGWTLVAGLMVAIPSGWLLAYLAALPFLLGLFFFVLIGLIVGAVMFRVGAKAPTPSAQTLWLIGMSVTASLLLSSLWAEYQALPRSVEKRVRDSFFESFTADRRAELSRGVRKYVQDELQNRYAPGGFVGYLRWAATNGTFTCPRILKASTVEYRLPHRRVLWSTRVGLSCLLVGWAVMSQLLGLRAVPRTASTHSDAEADTGPQSAP